MSRQLVKLVVETGRSFSKYPEYLEYRRGGAGTSDKTEEEAESDLYKQWYKVCRAHAIDQGLDLHSLDISVKRYWDKFLSRNRPKWYQFKFWF